MPVIVGSPRSGTTLLRFMLDAHPEMAIPPETGFLALPRPLKGAGETLRRQFFDAVTAFPRHAPCWNDFGIPADEFWGTLLEIDPFATAERYRAFYRTYAARFGKTRWGDKTPLYCLHVEAIAALLPEAHFIHMIRDGRDVALSLRETWFSPGHGMKAQAKHWCRCVSTAQTQGARCRNYLEVRYEDLVRDSARVLGKVCDFINLSYDPAMLQYYTRTPERLTEHRDRSRRDGTVAVSQATRLRQQALTMQPPQQSRIDVWKQEMSGAERRRFEATAGALLHELGYEMGGADEVRVDPRLEMRE